MVMIWRNEGKFVVTVPCELRASQETEDAYRARIKHLVQEDTGYSDFIGWFAEEELPKCPSECWMLEKGKLIASNELRDSYKRSLIRAEKRGRAIQLVSALQAAMLMQDQEWKQEIDNELDELKRNWRG